ncbi:MAG: hypothetical protein JXB49_13815 [Bacteroidales bacterium]|nr:hypothetical protein [Bacteroidales bacterium]
MKSRGNYFYFKKLELRTNYTQIPNELFYIDLSATEKLILAYLLSNSESFRVTLYRIEKSVGSDHRTVKKAIKKFQDMKLIVPVTNRMFSLNMVELMKLAQATKIKDGIDSNSTNSNLTNGESTTGSSTNSNLTTNKQVQLPVDSGNSTTNSVGDIPNNNSEQEEIEDERKEEKQKETISPVSGTEIQKEINEYLKSPSKYFWGDNVHLLVGAYEQYRVQFPDSKLNSIRQFDNVLYFYLLRATNSDNIQELNSILTGPISINIPEVHVAFKLIISKKDVNSEYKEEVLKVINAKKGKEDRREESDQDSEVA